MVNIFQLDFFSRLKAWKDLKDLNSKSDLKTICINVDKFWQQCPMVNYYLHAIDIQNWPSPWDLLNDNEYCVYARGLGMAYTLHLSNINDIKMYEAKDSDNIDQVLIIVDKYVLNYWPNTIGTNQIKDFQLGQQLNIAHLLDKIK